MADLVSDEWPVGGHRKSWRRHAQYLGKYFEKEGGKGKLSE